MCPRDGFPPDLQLTEAARALANSLVVTNVPDDVTPSESSAAILQSMRETIGRWKEHQLSQLERVLKEHDSRGDTKLHPFRSARLPAAVRSHLQVCKVHYYAVFAFVTQ